MTRDKIVMNIRDKKKALFSHFDFFRRPLRNVKMNITHRHGLLSIFMHMLHSSNSRLSIAQLQHDHYLCVRRLGRSSVFKGPKNVE